MYWLLQYRKHMLYEFNITSSAPHSQIYFAFSKQGNGKAYKFVCPKKCSFHVDFGCCRNNKLGTKGAISGCFSALADLYWSGKYSIIQPRIFLVREIIAYIFMFIRLYYIILLYYVQDFRKYLPVTWMNHLLIENNTTLKNFKYICWTHCMKILTEWCFCTLHHTPQFALYYQILDIE